MQKVKNFNSVLSLSAVLCIAVFVANPTKYMHSVSNGLLIWATAVVPALLPFFVLSKLLIELNFFDKLCKYTSPLTQKLFKAPAIAGYIFLISIISGYPVGAKLLQEYHKNGLLTQMQCKKISTFTSTSGPLFVLGTVGGGFFGNQKLGLILIGCHILSTLICGICLRNFYCTNDNTTILTKRYDLSKNILNDTIYSSISSILAIGVFLSLFFVIADMLPIDKINNKTIQAFVTGLLEITHGCKMLSQLNLSFKTTAVLVQTLISFGGICIICQSYAYLKDCNISFKELLFFKSFQASISAIITFVACSIF